MSLSTVLYTYAWLDCKIPKYADPSRTWCRRVQRWHHHYKDWKPAVLLDNGSSKEHCEAVAKEYGIEVVNAQPHLVYGTVGCDYPQVWRMYYYMKELLKTYEKIVFTATDAYICGQELLDYIESLDSGWTALWCHNHPESAIQVLTRNCESYEKFFAGTLDEVIAKYNGNMEEAIIPFTHVEKGFKGNRYGEMGWTPYTSDMAYYTQVSDNLENDDMFPVLRLVDGKMKVVTL
jgi:hypothetical protein